jgi:5-methylcytosine-specific restriction endonuclease McrA
MQGCVMSYDFDSLRFKRCDHAVPHRVRSKTCKDGRLQYYLQCERCGSSRGQPISNQLALELLNGNEAAPQDRELTWRYWRSFEEHRAHTKNKWRAMYDSYMRSEQWAQKRREVIERDQGICGICRDAGISEVHHLTYERVGREALDDLVGVCSACHAIEHGRVFEALDQERDVDQASGF